MTNLVERLERVRNRIAKTANAGGRSAKDIKLVAVSKKHSTNAINTAFEAGQHDFGENYLQEALAKITTLKSTAITWHFIGAIQSNKTQAIAENFHWVHTIDRLKVAQRLSAQRSRNLPPLNVCIQVNINDESGKAGIAAEEALKTAQAVNTLENLSLRGLMIIPQKTEYASEPDAFQRLASIFEDIKARFHWPQWDTLSMGMSADLETAVANGATIVRIGTDIFGPREQ